MSNGVQLTSEQREAFARAIYSGRKIEAIKQLRELSGLGLRESKDIIDRLEKELRAEHPERFTNRKAGCGAGVFVFVLVLGALWRLLNP